MAENTPNQKANKDKAEGERWSAEETSATKPAENTGVASKYSDEDGDNAGGITNRPFDEERDNQESLPQRGASRDESRNLGVGDEVEMDREERRSER